MFRGTGSSKILVITIMLLIMVLMVTRYFSLFRPVLEYVPVASPGKDLVLHGNSFGTEQGDGYAKLLLEDQEPDEEIHLEITSWTDSEIRAQLPERVNTERVQVWQSTPLQQGASEIRSFVVSEPDLPSEPYGYKVPAQVDSPWPTFRRDQRNTGSSPVVATYLGDQSWSFQTGKGIFSTPVIDNQGIIYIGSADHYFYALNPDGSEKWKYKTGEIIDSAAALGRFDPDEGYAPVTFISGDGFMYQFRTDNDIQNAEDRLLWKFGAELRPEVSFNRWFEGNVALGHDGTLYAGNTNFYYYAVNPDGTLKWTYETGSNNWSQAAFAEDGTIFWGSLDTFVRGVRPDG